MLIAINLFALIFHIVFAEKILHIYQCRNYNNLRYFKYFNKNTILFIIFCIFILIFEILFKFYWIILFINSLLIIYQLIHIPKLIISNKTPIKYTPKIKRLYIISVILFGVFIFFYFYVPALIIIFYLCPTISNFVNIYDKILNKKFIKKAKETIKNSNTRIIAITGSNGKTSVKNILFDFLSLNYKVLKTPSSYNTPLGIAKFINENFNSYYDFIILEYGARRKGDIRKLCKLYGANCGILTTISPQHLETFKTITNIKNTKNELPKFLHNKICIFNLENKICNELYLKKTGLKEAVSLSSNTNVFADNIKIKNGKTLFTLHSNNNQFNCQTNLLGKHNVLNILLAFSLAKNLNIETDKIVEAIKNLKPTPHRLELIRTHINILDDTYNCSISSATEALEVLKEFDGKKMVATPGIIECGKMKSEINKSLGEKLYFCDYIIIIGELNKNAILTGLKNKNFDINKIIICKTIEEAKSYFKLLKTNDTLLLLNDLPDDYK